MEAMIGIHVEPLDEGGFLAPQHPGAMPEGTVAAIVRQAGLTVDEFLDL